MYNLKQRFPYYLKQLLNKFHFHRNSGKRDIFIFSTFRSGSTWLAETLKYHPRIKFAIAPDKIEFLTNIDSSYKEIKPRPYYIDLTPAEKNILKDYVYRASRGEIVFGRRFVDLLSRKHSFITDRSVFRLLRSNYLAHWYRDNFNVDIIFLFRHPLAASISRRRVWNNSPNPSYWSPNVNYILQSPYFREKYLTEDLENFITTRNNNGTLLEKFILSWCMENLPLIEYIKSDEKNFFYTLTYEDLLINSQRVLSYLCRKLNLQGKKKLLNGLDSPSSTVYYSDCKTKNKFKNNNYNKNFLLKKWRYEISREKEKKLFEIINYFGIDIYQKNSFMPREKYLISK